MNKENFYEAIDILSGCDLGGTKYTTRKDGNTYEVFVFGACPLLLERLIKAGFSLNMGDFHGIGTALKVYKWER